MKFTISGKVTVSAWTVVEAETEDEARQIALNRELAQIHIDASFPDDECWHIDNDGLPEISGCEIDS
jgi:hypothetical protein